MIASTDTRMNREDARLALVKKIESQCRLLADPQAFSTIDPNYLIDDAERRLRWIDCAPEGARHCVAPMQDKQGVPMGTVWNENMGAGQALRLARSARGLHPISGARRVTIMTQFGPAKVWSHEPGVAVRQALDAANALDRAARDIQVFIGESDEVAAMREP